MARACKVPKKEGNVYGDKHPVQIEQDIHQKRDWDRIVGKQPSHPRPNVPGPSTSAPVPSPPHQPQEGTSSGEEEKPDSESEVEDSLEPAPDSEAELVARLAQEGGVHFQHFLVSKAISPNAENSSPKEWTYRDLLKLPRERLNEWKAACERKLDALNRRHVFDLVEHPKGWKVIRNRWVFDVKDDGRKRARLVAKGFSQVEGMDYDQVFVEQAVVYSTLPQEYSTLTFRGEVLLDNGGVEERSEVMYCIEGQTYIYYRVHNGHSCIV